MHSILETRHQVQLNEQSGVNPILRKTRKWIFILHLSIVACIIFFCTVIDKNYTKNKLKVNSERNDNVSMILRAGHRGFAGVRKKHYFIHRMVNLTIAMFVFGYASLSRTLFVTCNTFSYSSHFWLTWKRISNGLRNWICEMVTRWPLSLKFRLTSESVFFTLWGNRSSQL